MINPSALIAYSLKKLWLATAVSLVAFATLLSLMRFALPYLDDHKFRVQDYILENYGISLDIGHISATWNGSGPSLVLTEVAFSQESDSPVALDIDKVWVDLDLFSSLYQQLWISERFEMQGLAMSINTEKFDTDQAATPYSVAELLKELFLVQLESFTIIDGEIIVSGVGPNKTYVLEQLTWLNRGQQHQGEGLVRLKELTTNAASFKVDLIGDTTTLSGTFYTQAEALDISPWANNWLVERYPMHETRANLAAWISLKDNQFEQLQIDIGPSEIKWVNPVAQPQVTKIDSGNVQALPTENGWSFRVDQLIISHDEKTLITDLIGTADQQGNALVNTIKPIAIQSLFSLIPQSGNESLKSFIRRSDLSGDLATLEVNWEDKIPALQAKFIDISWQEVDNIPGLKGLSMDLSWHNKQGVLRVFHDNAELYAQNLIGKNISELSFDTHLYFYTLPTSQSSDWQLAMPMSRFENDQLSLEAGAQVSLSTGYTQIQALIDSLPLNRAPSLLPIDYVGKNTSAYLKRALAGEGQVTNAQVLWSGHAKHFPFETSQGIFQSAVDIKQSQLAFSKRWPTLEQLDLTLLFENQALHIFSPKGELSGIELVNLQATIPKLSSSSHLKVNAQASAQGKQVAELMMQSSLRRQLGEILDKSVVIDGNLSTDLKLDIPFSGGEIVATGQVDIQGADVSIPALDMTFEKVSGQLSFVNEKIDADSLSADLFGQGIEVSLIGNNADDNYQAKIQTSGDWQLNDMFDRLDVPLNSHLSGQTNWNARVGLEFSRDKQIRFSGTLNSDLLNVTSTLPYPLFKQETDVLPVTVNVVGTRENSIVEATVGDKTYFTGRLNHRPMEFTQSNVAIGNSVGILPSKGHHVIAAVDELELEGWFDVVTPFFEKETARKTRLFSVPDSIKIDTGKLTFANQLLENVRVNADQQGNHWRVDIAAKQADAKLVIPALWREEGIQLHADRLNLTAQKTPESSKPKFELSKPFPMMLRCDECRVNNVLLGEISADFRPGQDELIIDSLRVKHPLSQLQASGRWRLDGPSKTEINGTFISEDIGLWLQNFDLTTGIKDSESEIEFNFNWSGGPQDFALANLDGEMKWELTDGYLTEISDKGTRIFTLFSLNSLVRKLSLDFRDVFAKGFFYDDIRGSLSFDNGVAMTEDTVVDGGAGEIEIAGYTDLNLETLNYNVSFAPNVTGNLPLLVYFLTNPTTAIAALALDQMLTSAKVISNVNYRVTGTFIDPKVEEVERESREIELPARINPAPDNDVTIDSKVINKERVTVEVSGG